MEISDTVSNVRNGILGIRTGKIEEIVTVHPEPVEGYVHGSTSSPRTELK
jgi:hypothetical protein